MSELEEYDRRCERTPLTREQVDDQVDASRRLLETADKATAVELRRVLVWLSDRVVVLETELAALQGTTP